MGSNAKLKEVFVADAKHGAFYTGGNVEWHPNHLLCQTSTCVSVVDVETGAVRKVGEPETDVEADALQTFTSDGARIVTSHRSGLLKLWNVDGQLEKAWKYIHKGPVASLRLIGEELASGGSDGVVRTWDLEHRACTAGLRGCQGVVNALEYGPDGAVFASGDDGKICRWSDGEASYYAGHFSKVTCIAFHHDDEHFVSAGRDKVLLLWKVGTTSPLRTLPVYETVESILALPRKFKLPEFKSSGDGIYVISGGESGALKVWDVKGSKLIYKQTDSLISKAKEEGGLAISKLVFDKSKKTVGVISAEQNIILTHLKSFAVLKQLVGFSDEILDACFVGELDTHLAVATNTPDIKLYHTSTMNCSLLKGHTDIVLSLNRSPFNHNLIVSTSKDNTIRLWLLSDQVMTCVGIGARHTGSVGSACFGRTGFVVSVSQDTCVKIWDVPDELGSANNSLTCRATEVAHGKDINAVCVSPNDKIIATASQDKTAKLWSENLTLLGVLKGHRRGVWCVRFSPVDQVVLTSSADCSVKLWSIAELNCLKTIEGHESSVVRCEFLSSGMQILTAGADGLVKLFNVKTSECAATWDEHESRIWALAIRRDETGFVTGGSDSTLVVWKDVTDERRAERAEEAERLTLEEQRLSNYVQNDELLKALRLALKLDRPNQVLKIVQGVLRKGDSGLTDAIRELDDDQKEALLRFATEWNTNSRNCQQAQLVLNVLLNEMQGGRFRPQGLRATIEAALPYTERHFNRLTQLMQDLHFITYTVNCMRPHAKK